MEHAALTLILFYSFFLLLLLLLLFSFSWNPLKSAARAILTDDNLENAFLVPNTFVCRKGGYDLSFIFVMVYIYRSIVFLYLSIAPYI